MLCLGCLLGSVLINIVRDMMMDGAVILGVPFLYSTWHQLNSAAAWDGWFQTAWRSDFLESLDGYLWFITGGLFPVREVGLFVGSFWEAHLDSTIILTEVKISWMRMVLGLSSSRSWWIFLLSCVSSCLSCWEWLRKWNWIMLLLNRLGSVTVAHWFTTGIIECHCNILQPGALCVPSTQCMGLRMSTMHTVGRLWISDGTQHSFRGLQRSLSVTFRSSQICPWRPVLNIRLGQGVASWSSWIWGPHFKKRCNYH